MVLSARDRHPGVELGRLRRAERLRRAVADAAEREGEGQSGRALDEAAAADAGVEEPFLMCLFMAQASRAARWMARTMRG